MKVYQLFTFCQRGKLGLGRQPKSGVAVAVFGPLLDLLAEVPDPRRAQGKLYSLPHVLLFAILAIVTGCNSSRGIVTFIDVHRRKLNEAFGLTCRCRHPRRGAPSSVVWSGTRSVRPSKLMIEPISSSACR